MNTKAAQKIDFAVGGQAVIEGVMMRSPNFVTIAVRKPKGDIILKDERFRSIAAKIRLLGIPLVRGVINLFEMMVIGMRMINFSASQAIGDDDDDSPDKTGEEGADAASSRGKSIGKIGMAVSFILSLGFSLG